MKTFRFFLLAGALMLIPAMIVEAQPIDNPQKDLELVISSEDGNNGMAVTWNPTKKLYYAAFGGNADYPLEVFTAEGKNVYSAPIGYDIRGLAYHQKMNCLVGNMYDEGGYFKIYLNESGMPTGQNEVIAQGMHQPDKQSGGTFNTKKGIMYCIGDLQLYQYNIKDGKPIKQFALTGFSAKEYESCVTGTILYTAKKGYEFMLINYVSNKIYFFNAKGGYVKMTYFNPAEYLHDYFNISYCNNRLWTYNKDSRKWTSYILFK